MDEKTDEKMECFNFMINRIMRITKSANPRNVKLQKICDELKDNFEHYDWVGFYLANESTKELTLGPFAGEPTEHTKISFGSGICGQAAETRDTFVVQDVSSETNYLSCSPAVKSEIVVPVLRGERVVAELDIDSHMASPFTDSDKEFLENVCNTISQLF
jgi:GAF domain-containing protein